MASVFKKLISRELGEYNYRKYFICYQKLISEDKYDFRKLDNEEIFNDMYMKLKDKDIITLTKMLERLSDSMFLALRISKTYIFSFLVYVTAILFLLVQGMPVLIFLGSAAIISICFFYKTYEFIINKYCFIDAHIVIVYKAVLDRLIISYELNHKS